MHTKLPIYRHRHTEYNCLVCLIACRGRLQSVAFVGQLQLDGQKVYLQWKHHRPQAVQ